MKNQKLTKKQEVQLQFLTKLMGAVQQVFDEDSEFYIGELNNEGLTDFIHVLANGVPARFYNELTGQNIDHLEFNHLANKLCFQNGKLK